MFATRGFDNVKVSEVAERVGVSEKTIYNYFPTKESLVLDTADEAVERMARALRERGPGESLTAAVVRAIKEDIERFDQAPDELVEFIPLFLGMIDSTPALRAAWLEMHDRLANVARDELAAQAGIDPRDPEPIAAGRALAGLAEVALESRVRRIREGLRGEELQRAVDDDLERAARLLETGLWSFSVPRSQRAKQQALEAARAAEDARTQVLKALRQARAAWAEVRREGGAGWDARSMRQEIQHHFREAQDQAKQHAERQAKQHAQRQAKHHAQRQARDGRARRRPGMTTVAVLGAGGVGGFVAAALARSGADVVVVTRPQTAAALDQAGGLTVSSRALGEDFTRPSAGGDGAGRAGRRAVRRHQGDRAGRRAGRGCRRRRAWWCRCSTGSSTWRCCARASAPTGRRRGDPDRV